LTFFAKYNILVVILNRQKKSLKQIKNKVMEGSTLAIGDMIVGIDIGTSKVTTAIGEINEFNQLELIATAECKCFGMRKSKITDEEEVASAISKTIYEIEEVANIKINSAYVTVLGKYVTIVNNKIVKEAKDKYDGITAKDVSSAILQLRGIEIPEDKVITDIIVDEFALDNGKIVDSPIGMLSSTFTVSGQIILVDKEYVRQISNIFKKVGIERDGIISNVQAQRKLVLDKNEQKDNVMILDIGAGNCDIGVFFGEQFVYTETIPIGGDNITSDIAYVFNITEEEADRLKKQYGLALRSFIDNDTDIMLNSYKGQELKKTIKSSELIEVVEARIEEIFSLVNKNITAVGVKSNINNVVLTGQGISTINKSDVSGKIILNIPVKISTGRLMSIIKPECRAAYALVKYVSGREFTKSVSSKIDVKSTNTFLKDVLARVKEFFYT